MGTFGLVDQKPHAVCIPYPGQGHINPMLKLAKLLHFNGFHITFVNTQYNHHRLLRSRGPDSLFRLPSFQFMSIPDGLSLDPTPDDAVPTLATVAALSESTRKHCLAPFQQLLVELNQSSSVPPVSCIVSDGAMDFTLDAARDLGVPNVLFWTTSACGFLAYVHYRRLIDMGIVPLQDESFLTNGYLDTVIDCIPGMEGIRLRDLPSFIRTTNPDDETMLNFVVTATDRTQKYASAIVLNTFDALEHRVISSLSSTLLPPIYSIGPLQSILKNQVTDMELQSIESNLWKEDTMCLEWLDSKEPNSVVYASFGSITVMARDQLIEFAWGLANSNHPFLWVIRPDLVKGDAAILPPEFIAETKERGLLASWCPQEDVLRHPSIGGFLTHCGWNSTLESISAGVPMICWPFFAEQQTNCRYCCVEWGVGMEIESDVKREEVERLVRELMEGEKGKVMKLKAMEWKKMAEEAVTSVTGSSYLNLHNMINQILLKSSPKQ